MNINTNNDSLNYIIDIISQQVTNNALHILNTNNSLLKIIISSLINSIIMKNIKRIFFILVKVVNSQIILYQKIQINYYINNFYLLI